MGVVGAEAVASFAGHDPLCLHQLKDEARQPGRHLLETHVGDSLLVEGEALAQELYGPYAQLGLSPDESVKSRASQEGDPRNRYCLSIRTLTRPGSEGRLPEHLPGLQHADSHFLSGFDAVDAHPSFEEQEEYLAPVDGGENVLAHLEGLGRDAVGDPPQLLLREQREEVDPGKEHRVVLIQPKNQLSAHHMASYVRLLYPMILTTLQLSAKIVGHWDFAALYADR